MSITSRHPANPLDISSDFILSTYSQAVEKLLEQRVKEGQKSLRIVCLLHMD